MERRRRRAEGNERLHAETERIMKKYLELRYRLMPYIYTAARETSETGLPMMRAMWLHHPDDPVAVARGDQFFWGRDLLVAPVVEKGAAIRKVYLPKGVWYDFWTGERVEGGREIERKVDLETTPIYARAGAIVPIGPVKQYVDETVAGPLTLQVYPGADGSASIYDDDGRSFEYRKGQFMRIEARWDDAARRMRLALGPGSRMLPPGSREIEVVVAGSKDRRTVTFAGKQVEVR
jgi:alpha-glucosidase (family GH31 glycosyl hydrolase)